VTAVFRPFWHGCGTDAGIPGEYQLMAPGGGMWSAADLGSVLLVQVRTSRCALCDNDGAVVVHEGHLIGCGYFQEFLDGANNQDNAHTRRLVWDAYAENTSERRL
jgi:hypothetical protein